MDKTPTPAAHTRSCSRCQFCGSTSTSEKTLQLICRKKPPTVAAALMMTREGQPQWTGVTNWPAVSSSDWCAEFEAQLH